MDIDQLLTDLDEEHAEKIEIMENIHAAVMSGEITPEEAEEIRAALEVG